MSIFQIISILLTLAAAFAYVNYRFIRLPTTIGVMLLALLASLALVGIGELRGGVKEAAAHLLGRIDFEQALLHGMLALLLFAGAMHVDLAALRREKVVVGLLATAGVVLSTLAVGGAGCLVFRAMGLQPSMMGCLLLGALISPTDPIAVLGIMRTAGAPKDLELQISGESLFNDGIGVVVFLVVLEIARGGAVTPGGIAWLALKEAAGGLGFGLLLGLVGFVLLRRVNQYQVEVLLTLALAMGGYAAADAMRLSAPITVVVAGLIVGNPGRAYAMSAETRRNLDTFWELIDDILNAVLFLLIGLEVLVLPFSRRHLVAGLALIPVILVSRWLIVAAVVGSMRRWRPMKRGSTLILTWAGLRGAISVALALSLPAIDHIHREAIIAITYVVVVFSIFVQGLTIGRLVRRYTPAGVHRDAVPM